MSTLEITQGLVVRIKGADYIVASENGEVRCSLRGRFRLSETAGEVLPVVGDTVRFRKGEGRDARAPQGLIMEIMPRKSVLARTDPSQRRGYQVLGANMDQAIIVCAVRDPLLNLRLLDRMLVAAAAGGMDAVICVNKMDLAGSAASIEEPVRQYRSMGYRVMLSSAVTGVGVDDLRGILAGKLSILSGPSGGGKTSLLARVQPGLELAISPVSARTGKGRHTTTHFELHPLACGGFLGDTPGIREFGIQGVTRGRLSRYFRDFAPCEGHCRFAACSHSHEPDCAVKEAVAERRIARERYESYLRILETLPER